eukprot:TRINITY_DN39451_c0_g1_i1.p1 TRINITY_DN39451_c0_g1~~TRINITY_DN39451_c0_g1_i1.p1  ORF type:complete len:140 (-),score=4.35 TRINITY_DN39451_c0_g1_i1:6-425(-)
MCIRDRNYTTHFSLLLSIPFLPFTFSSYDRSNIIFFYFCTLFHLPSSLLPYSLLEFYFSSLTVTQFLLVPHVLCVDTCLLYTSDAADDTPCVDLGGLRIIKKKKISVYRINSHQNQVNEMLTVRRVHITYTVVGSNNVD